MLRWLTRKHDTDLCQCEHGRNAHTHFNRITNCGLCKCLKFKKIRKRERGLVAR